METTANFAMLFPIMVGLGSSFSHCIGMCGPIQLSLQSSNRTLAGFFSFHSGRTLSYVILGMLTAIFGSLIHGRSFPPLVMASKILIMSFYLTMAAAFWGFGKFNIDNIVAKLFPVAMLTEAGLKAKEKSIFLAGIITGFLPCPTTYAVLIWALPQKNIWAGPVGMFLLGISIVPSFALMWFSLGWKKLWTTRVFYKVISIVFLLLVIYKIYMMITGKAACQMRQAGLYF